MKKSQNCPRGALAANRRKCCKGGRFIWVCPDRWQADRGSRSPAEDPGSEVHTHRRWRCPWPTLPPASLESCPGAGDIGKSTAGQFLWVATAVRREPMGPCLGE